MERHQKGPLNQGERRGRGEARVDRSEEGSWTRENGMFVWCRVPGHPVIFIGIGISLVLVRMIHGETAVKLALTRDSYDSKGKNLRLISFFGFVLCLFLNRHRKQPPCNTR